MVHQQDQLHDDIAFINQYPQHCCSSLLGPWFRLKLRYTSCICGFDSSIWLITSGLLMRLWVSGLSNTWCGNLILRRKSSPNIYIFIYGSPFCFKGKPYRYQIIHIWQTLPLTGRSNGSGIARNPKFYNVILQNHWWSAILFTVNKNHIFFDWYIICFRISGY